MKHFTIPLVGETTTEQGAATLNQFLPLLELWLTKLLPEERLAPLREGLSSQAAQDSIEALNKDLPFFHTETPEKTPGPVFGWGFFSGKSTWGTGRYFSDRLATIFSPDKPLQINSYFCFCFAFTADIKTPFLVVFASFLLNNDEEMARFLEELNRSQQPMRLSLRSVQKARQINKEKKSAPGSLNRFRCASLDVNMFWKIQSKIAQSGTDISNTDAIPDEQNSNPFWETEQLAALLPFSLCESRKVHLIEAILANLYLLISRIKEAKSEEEQLIIVDTVNAYDQHTGSVIGITGAVRGKAGEKNLSKHDLLQAMSLSLPHAICLEESLWIGNTIEPPLYFFYCELEKKNKEPFSSRDRNHACKEIPNALKKVFQSETHNIFLPKNEEDIARSIVLLHNEFRKERSRPQMLLFYERQEQELFFFTAIIVHEYELESRRWQEALAPYKPSFSVHKEQTRILGKEGPEPASNDLLTVTFQKTKFLREDKTLNLIKARRLLAQAIKAIMPEVRDLNGGILAKLKNSCDQLRKHYPRLSKAKRCFLENFFYSLTPYGTQAVLPTKSLCTIFDQLLALWNTPYDLIKTSETQEHLLITMKTHQLPKKNEVEPLLRHFFYDESEPIRYALFSQNQLLYIAIIAPRHDRKNFEALCAALHHWIAS